MAAACVEIDGVERLAGGHEEAVALGPAEADVGADLRQQDQTDPDAVGGEDVDAVVALSDPAGGRVDVPLSVAADAVGHAGDSRRRACPSSSRRTRGRGRASCRRRRRRRGCSAGLGIMGCAGVGDVEGLVVGGEAEAVGFEEVVGDLGELAGLRVDAVDRLLDFQRALVPLVVHQRAVAGIGEPDAAVGVDDGVVGGIERFAVEPVSQDGRLAVVLVADDAAVAVLAGDLAALAIEGVAVGVAGGVAHHADVAVVLEPAELDVVGDVGPDEVLADAVPGRALGPEHARMEAPDGRVADLDLGEALVEDDDVGIGVAGGLGVAGPYCGGGVWALAAVPAAQAVVARAAPAPARNPRRRW